MVMTIYRDHLARATKGLVKWQRVVVIDPAAL